MMNLKIIFLSLFLIAALSHAQNYIDIDLSPPQPKEQKKSSPQIKVAPPKVKPKAAAKPATPPTPAPKVNPVVKQEPVVKKTATKEPKLKLDDAPKAPPVPTSAPAVKPTAPPKITPIAKPTPIPVPTPVAKPTPTPPLKEEEPPPVVVAPAPVQRPKADPVAKAAATEMSNRADLDIDEARFKNRHAFAIDYSTWYEMMKLTEMTSRKLTEANTHYFGVSFGYDYTVYREKWGYAFTAGFITGNAQAGTKDSGDYFERRIPWTGYRGGGRLFTRASNRIDIGMGFIAQSKMTKWPLSDTYTIIPQSNPQYFYYLDTRWRLNYKYELIQSFGAHLRSYSMAWMLGISYTLN